MDIDGVTSVDDLTFKVFVKAVTSDVTDSQSQFSRFTAVISVHLVIYWCQERERER